MTLGEKIHRVSEARRAELSRIASDAGIPYNTLRGYTQGGKMPSASNGISLARALNVGIEWLFDDSQGWPPPAYHEAPPVTLDPWPPHGITWGDMRRLVHRYKSGQVVARVLGWIKTYQTEPEYFSSLSEDDRRQMVRDAGQLKDEKNRPWVRWYTATVLGDPYAVEAEAEQLLSDGLDPLIVGLMGGSPGDQVQLITQPRPGGASDPAADRDC